MRLRGSTRSTLALLTALLFMLSVAFNVLPVQAGDTEGPPTELLEPATGISDDGNQLDNGDAGTTDGDIPAETPPAPPEEATGEPPELEPEADNAPGRFNINSFQPMEAAGPAELTISGVTINSFNVSWPEAAGASGYKVTVSNTTGGFTTNVVNGATTEALAYDVTGLNPSYRYDVLVEATGGSWAGDVSSLTAMAITGTPLNKQGLPCGTFDFVSGTPGSGPRYLFMPAAELDSATTLEKFFIYQEQIYPDKDRLLWYMQAGFNNTNARDHVNSFRVFNLTDKVEVPLDYGTTNFGSGTGSWPAYSATEGDDVLTNLITSGDFKVAKLSKGGTWIRFELDIADKLESGKQYEVTLDPQFHTGGNNPTYLNKVYHFRFNTGIQDNTPPTWPEGAALSADGISESGLTLRWPAANDDSNVIAKYIVTVSKAGGIIKTAETTAQSYAFTDLDSNTEYEFSVKAADIAKNQSEALTAKITTAAQVPQWPAESSLSISNLYPTELVINWPEVTDTDFAEYRVYVDGVEEARLASQTYYELGGLDSGHRYDLKVVPYNVSGYAGAALETMVVTPGGGGLVFDFAPQAIDKGESDYYHHYELVYPVDLDNLVLTWNFGNGLDKNLRQNLECIRLMEKVSGKQINLDLGQLPYVGNEDGVFAAGDFTYTSSGGGTGGGSGTGQAEIDDASKIRMLKFAPQAATRAQMSPASEYVLEIDPEFTANNGLNTLGKIFTFSFVTAGDDSVAPAWPENAEITASSVGPTSVVLSWPPATDNVAVSSYQVLQGAALVKSIGGQSTSYKVENLVPNTAYEFTVIAKDAKGNASDGLKATVTTLLTDNEAPVWPDGSKIIADNVLTDNLDLSWTEARDNLEVTGYRLLKNGETVADVDAAVMSYHIIGLAPATNYIFKVEARDEYGNYSKTGPQVAVSTIAGEVDSLPPTWTNNGSQSSSIVYAIKETRATLTWPWAADNVAVYGYELYREGSLIAALDAYSNSYTDILVPDGKAYGYVVYALDGAGNKSSGKSYSILSGNPDPDTKSPYWPAGTYIDLSEFTDTTVKVHWSEAQDNVGVRGYVVVKDGLWTEYADPGEENDHRSYINRFAIYDPKYNTSGIASNYPPLSPGETYTFSIKAFDLSENSSKGDPQLTFVMGTNPTAGSKVPFALVNLDNTRGSLNSLTGALNRVTMPQDPQKVKFTWEFAEPLADGYADKIMVSPIDDQQTVPLSADNFGYQLKDGKGILTLDLGQTGIQLDDDGEYVVKLGRELAAQGGKAIGLDIAWQFTTAKDDKTAPEWENASLKATAAITPSIVTLEWPPATDNVAVTQYQVYQGAELLATLPAEARSYHVEGLELGQSYLFKVAAGDYLNNFSVPLEVSITTPAADNEKPAWPDNAALSFSDICSDNVTVTWPPAIDNYQVTAYDLYINDAAEPRASAAGNITSYKITGLQGETLYTIRIIARDAAGNASLGIAGEVTTVMDDVRPLWPENSQLQVKDIQDTAVTLYWTAATDNVGIAKYNIYQDEVLVATAAGDVTEYTVTGLIGSTEYKFAVEAVDAKDNQTTDRLSINQWTAPNTTTSGGNFGFKLLAPASHNLSLDIENNVLRNEIDSSFTRNNVSFTFTFAKNLQNGTWLNNIVLSKDGTVVALPAEAFSYTAKAGDSDARLKIAVPVASLESAGGNYLLTVKDTLAAEVEAGDPSLGRTFTWAFNVYVGAYGVTDIAAGYNSYSAFKKPSDRFYLMLKDDGSVWSWGNNDYGTLGDGTTDRREAPVKVDDLANIVALEAGRDSCFALDRDGAIWAWGSNEYGQLGKGFVPRGTDGRYGNSTPQKITAEGFPAIKKLSFGFGQVVAIDVTGEVWNWGFNVKDGYSSEAKRSGTPLKVAGLSKVIDVAGCFDSSLAVTAEGDVYTFGEGKSPSKIEGLSQIVAVDGQGIDQRNTICMALKADGTVYIWDKEKPQPQVVANASQVKAISADGPYVLGSDGQVRTVVYGSSPGLGADVFDLNNVSQLASSAQGGLALLKNGSLLQFIGNETTPVNLSMDPVEAPVWPEDSVITVSNLTEAGLTLNWNQPDSKVSGFTIYQNETKIASVSGNQLAYNVVGLTKGQTYTFKVEARFAQSPWSTTGPTLAQTMLSNWNPAGEGAGKIAAGGRHTLLVDSAGKVWAWGQNDYGQLGINNHTQQLEPVQVNGLSNVVAVAAGDNHSLALDTAGDVWAWGRNNLYQLGNDTTADSLVPIKVYSGAKAISAAANYSLALRTDGTVWGWGEAGEANCSYALTNGNGHTPVQMCYNTNRPTDIHPLTGVKGIAAAPRFVAYLFNDGRLYRQGYFIDSVGAPTYSPMGHYCSLMGVQGIAAGDDFVVALLEDGTVATLGNNLQGQFGNGGQSNATPASPVPYAKVKGLSNVVGIAAGGAHGIARQSDGSVWAWGKNQYGQLGNGTNMISLVPVQVQLSGVNAVAGGRNNTLAMQSDKKVYAWGDNSAGQLGSGDKLNSKLPVLVRMAGYDQAVDAPVWPTSFTIVKKAQTADSITLLWTPAKSGISIAGYEVYQDGEKVGEVSGSTYEYTVKNLQKDTDYTFGIKAKDSAENLSVLSKTITLKFTGIAEGSIDNQAPEWVAGAVIATDGKSPYTITISWPAAIDDVAVTSYRIFANGKPSGATSQTGYTISGLSPDQEYTITVEALDAAFNVSEALFATIKTPATMPMLRLAEITNKGDISLTFSKAMADPAGTQAQFAVQVDGTEVAVESVEGTNTAEKIKLVFAEENKVKTGQKATITYTKGAEASRQIMSADGTAVDSFVAQIGTPAPALTADTTDNKIGQAIDITFVADTAWMRAITDVTVDGTSIEGKYAVSAGRITLSPEVFNLPGEYFIAVKAEGYSDAGITQVISSDQGTAGRLVIFQKPYESFAGPTGGVGITGEFKVGFSEQILPESLNISLYKAGKPDQPVAFTYELIQNKALSIKTTKNLDYGTSYELVLPAGIEDIKGNRSENDSKLAFYTVAFKQPVYKVTRGGQEVNGVEPGQSYQLVATLENRSEQPQTVDAILQLRGGKGAREDHGGDVLAQRNQSITLASGQTTDITLEFTVPQDIDGPVIYGDIFTWEKEGSYASAAPVRFSCPVE